MPVQPWEVIQLQGPAEQMCCRMNENPHEIVMDANGVTYPRWMDYATRMAEHRIMLAVLRDYFGQDG